MKKIFLVLMIALLFVAACSPTQTETTTDTTGDTEAAAANEAVYAPDFEATTITGEQVSLAAYKEDGKPLLVYFTASWCSTCAKNWPAIEEVYGEYNDRVNFLSISIDPTDTQEVMSALADEKGLTYPIVPGNPDIMLGFGVSKQATTIGVSSDGEIVFSKEKEVLTVDEYRALLDELLENE